MPSGRSKGVDPVDGLTGNSEAALLVLNRIPVLKSQSSLCCREHLPAMSRRFYFSKGSQVHWEEGFWQPLQTLFSILRPHLSHGLHPHVWHMAGSFRLAFGLPDFGGVSFSS